MADPALSPYLHAAVTKIECEERKGARFSYAVANCQGWRNTQEDAHMVLLQYQENTSLFTLYDGHNGQAVARFVAKYLPTYLSKNTSYNKGNIEAGLQEVFLLIDDDLLRNKDINEVMIEFKDSSLRYKEIQPIAMAAGCTAVVLLIKNDIYYCANVGDSRCVVAREGKAWPLTKDHKPDSPEEKARIEKAGGNVVNGRINMGIDVSRSFGDGIYKRNFSLGIKEQMITPMPYTVVQKMEKNDDFIVLFCDGIWNAMSNQQLVDFIAKRIKDMPLVKICEEVIKHVLPSVFPPTGITGKDNMTVMIIKPNSTSEAVPASSSRTNTRTGRKGTSERLGLKKQEGANRTGSNTATPGSAASWSRKVQHHKAQPAENTTQGDKIIREIRSSSNNKQTSPTRKRSRG